MTSASNFHLLDFIFKINQFSISQFFLCNFQAKYLSNYAEHLKKLAPYYTLPLFTNIFSLLYKISTFNAIRFSQSKMGIEESIINLVNRKYYLVMYYPKYHYKLNYI